MWFAFNLMLHRRAITVTAHLAPWAEGHSLSVQCYDFFVPCDLWHVTCDMWLVTHDKRYFFKLFFWSAQKCRKVFKGQDFLKLMLLPAHTELVSPVCRIFTVCMKTRRGSKLIKKNYTTGILGWTFYPKKCVICQRCTCKDIWTFLLWHQPV